MTISGDGAETEVVIEAEDTTVTYISADFDIVRVKASVGYVFLVEDVSVARCLRHISTISTIGLWPRTTRARRRYRLGFDCRRRHRWRNEGY